MTRMSTRSFFAVTRLAAPWLAAGALLAACGGGSGAPTIRLAGEVQKPASFSFADLQALPASTQTDTFSSAGASQTHTYTGTSLWGLLDAAVINVDPSVKNDVLDKYLLATGSDAYRVVFSAGELDPAFGSRASLVAYAETANGTTAPLGDDGFARVTAPGDIKGGRYVSNLARLDVASSGATTASQGGGVSTQFSVSGAVLHPGSYDLAALQALPPVTQAAGTSSYTGVGLWNFLNNVVGLKTDPATKNPTLSMYVVATGSDGYRALFALGELDPGFGNQPDLIAYAVGGAGLGASGFARIVVPNDAKAGRYVSNLIALEVFVAPAAP